MFLEGDWFVGPDDAKHVDGDAGEEEDDRHGNLVWTRVDRQHEDEDADEEEDDGDDNRNLRQRRHVNYHLSIVTSPLHGTAVVTSL